MSYTLTHPTAGAGSTPITLTLPTDMQWIDEFAWAQVEQVTQYTTTGALIVEAAAKQTGRPITIQGDQDRAWCERGQLKTLRNWAALPGQHFTLVTFDGASHSVVFDHARNAIEAEALVPWTDLNDTDPYKVTLKFMEL